MRMDGYLRACWTVVVPLLVVIAATVVLEAVGDRQAASAVGLLGTLLALLGNLAYIVLWHSRSRWPGVPWRQRLTKVLWFER